MGDLSVGFCICHRLPGWLLEDLSWRYEYVLKGSQASIIGTPQGIEFMSCSLFVVFLRFPSLT